MIHKIERLISIGKFRNYNASGPVDFKKLTVIYGDNGGGKTTLTSVIRSLTSNNPSIVRSRISTNHTAPQAVQIIQTGTPNIFHTFGSAGWTFTFPDIEIFDIHFVNENVYSGFDFNEEHKKQLHQFVIGAQGIAIQQQIERNKSDKTSSRQNQAAYERQLIQQVGNNLTLDSINQFLNIPIAQNTNIDQLIRSAEAVLASANSNSVLQTLLSLSSHSQVVSRIDFDSLMSDLQTTSQSIQNTALQTLFSNHCQDLSDNLVEGPEIWLQKGFAYIENKKIFSGRDNPTTINCPFCKQTISGTIEIVNAYAQQFDTEFNSLIYRLQEHLTLLLDFNLETVIQGINNINQVNNGRIVSWTPHLPITVQTPTVHIIYDDSALRNEFQALIATVRQKIQNPSTNNISANANVFQSSLETINTNIHTYNQIVNEYNIAIATFLASIQLPASAQLEVDRLKRIKRRFETPIAAICTQLVTERQNLRALEVAYPTLVHQQETAATTFFNSYQTQINYYLGTVFKTLFRIDDVVHVPPRGMAIYSKIGYKLTIDGADISFVPNQPFSAKECLSEGDKSTIALAFFLSKLDIDPNRSNKILVFDDPLSSLDTNRRTYTIGIIKNLCLQIKQVIVLSHNEYFLHEIYKGIIATERKSLRITENFAARESIIEPCDLEDLVKIDYFKHIEALEEFRTNPNHAIKDTVLGWLRNVLESHLRFKFYKEIRTMTGQKTFGRLVSFLDASGVVFRDNVNRPSIIANLNLINSVSWMPHHGIPMPDYSTLGLNPHTISAPELDNLIQDTLNLIENQL